jgi:hypothetical protein
MTVLYDHPVAAALTLCACAYLAAAVALEWGWARRGR